MIWMYRSGKPEDPFIPITQTLRIKDGVVLLEEIPDSFQRPAVAHDTITFSEIQSGDPGATNYRIIYKYGIIVFNHANNGELVTVNYFGTGRFFLSADRLYLNVDENNNVTQTLKNLLDDNESAIEAISTLGDLVARIDEFQHMGTYNVSILYQPRNVVDDGNGNSYMAVQESVGQALSNTAYWRIVAKKGDKGDTGDKGDKGERGIQGDKGLNWKGEYNASTTYAVDDAVYYSTTGGSYICISSSTGNVPTNTAYWQLLAKKGADGAGAGDVIGPASAVDGRIAVFDDVTGKLIKDGGSKISDMEPAFTKNTAFNKNFGTIAGTVCDGGDSRLSDARTPTSHGNDKHSNNYATETALTTTDNKIGNLTNLETVNKTNVVSAINELVDYGGRFAWQYNADTDSLDLVVIEQE